MHTHKITYLPTSQLMTHLSLHKIVWVIMPLPRNSIIASLHAHHYDEGIYDWQYFKIPFRQGHTLYFITSPTSYTWPATEENRLATHITGMIYRAILHAVMFA
jgi:hypothetical protein